MNERQVESRLKPDPQPCACGCGIEGIVKKDGHVKVKCQCVTCRNRNNSRRGKRSQATFQKAAGIKRAAARGANANEEWWRDYFVWEHKDGAQVRPVVTAYRRIRAQIESNRAIGDHRPAAVGVTSDGIRLVVIEAQDWATHVVPRFADEGDIA